MSFWEEAAEELIRRKSPLVAETQAMVDEWRALLAEAKDVTTPSERLDAIMRGLFDKKILVYLDLSFKNPCICAIEEAIDTNPSLSASWIAVRMMFSHAAWTNPSASLAVLCRPDGSLRLYALHLIAQKEFANLSPRDESLDACLRRLASSTVLDDGEQEQRRQKARAFAQIVAQVLGLPWSNHDYLDH